MAKEKVEYEAPDSLADLQALLRKQGYSSGYDLNVQFIPTGISSLDHSIGGGIPRQRLTLLQGEEHSGKTLILLAAIASVQRAGGTACFIDGEHALSPDFARLLGVDFESLVVERPRTLDQAYNLIRAYARSGFFDIVGFDSVTALTTEAELDTPAEESGKRASVPQMHSKELPKLTATTHEKTAVVFINQMRENPNPPTWYKGGKLLYATGGKALRHYNSLTVEVKKGLQHKTGDIVVGQQIKTYTPKNKVGTPYQRAEFDLMFDKGLDLVTDLIDTAERLGVIEKQSSWFYIDIVDLSDGEVLDRRKYAGRANLEQALRDDSDLVEHVQRRVAVLTQEEG